MEEPTCAAGSPECSHGGCTGCHESAADSIFCHSQLYVLQRDVSQPSPPGGRAGGQWDRGLKPHQLCGDQAGFPLPFSPPELCTKNQSYIYIYMYTYMYMSIPCPHLLGPPGAVHTLHKKCFCALVAEPMSPCEIMYSEDILLWC